MNSIGKFYEDATDTTGDTSKNNTDNNGTVPIPPINPDGPNKNDTNTTTNETTDGTNNGTVPVNPDKPDNGGGIHVQPGDHPDDKSWFQRNGTWVAIVCVLIVVTIAAVAYSCWKRK